MNKRRILVIDDEDHLRDAVSSALETNGYEALTASSGEEGLKKAIDVQPDLILLDILMPDIDGLEVLHRLRNNPKTQLTPVIMLSVKGETGSLFNAERLRATDYIIKPFDAEELLKLIGKYIALRDTD